MRIYVRNLSTLSVPIFQSLQYSCRNCPASAWPGMSAEQSCPIHHCSAQALSSSLKKLCLQLEWLLSGQAVRGKHACHQQGALILLQCQSATHLHSSPSPAFKCQCTAQTRTSGTTRFGGALCAMGRDHIQILLRFFSRASVLCMSK